MSDPQPSSIHLRFEGSPRDLRLRCLGLILIADGMRLLHLEAICSEASSSFMVALYHWTVRYNPSLKSTCGA